MSIIGKIGREIGEEVAEGLVKKAAPKVMPAVKKPLEWGFKGRKPTDIEDIDYVELAQASPDRQNIFYRNRKKLKKGAEKNKYINEVLEDPDYANIEDDFWPSDLIEINREFKGLQNWDVPRELTGKMIGHKLGLEYIRKVIRESNKPSFFQRSLDHNEKYKLADWRKGWLRYYNELDDKQKETFDILSNEWDGKIDELVDAAKLL